MAPIRTRFSLGRDAPEIGVAARPPEGGATVAPPPGWGGAGSAVPAVVPVRTHILTPRDDLAEVIRTYAGPLLGPGVVVAVSESAVAIVQRRYLNPDDVKPGAIARLVSRFVDRSGSLSSPYALQAVMNEEGAFRVTGAFILGLLSRLILRRRGDFYRLAGPQASLVDDVTGTLPPFDKYIVLGPADPQGVVDKLRRSLGVQVAIVDANDLGEVHILAASERVNRQVLTGALRSNPAGNDDQQTPIVIVRNATL